MNAATPPAASRDNAIGFLRVVLASMVIYTHGYLLGGFGEEPLSRWTGGRIMLGPLAVHAFFTLSGFLVTESFRHSRSVWSYLWKRALRLLPGLWVCLFVTAFVFTPALRLLHDDAPLTARQLLPEQIGYVARNLFLPRTQINIHGHPSLAIPYGGDWNGSLWTLFYEGSCYIMVAALGILTLLGKRHRPCLAVILGFLALNVAWRLQPAFFPPIVARLFNTAGKFETLHFLAGVAWALAPASVTRSLSRPWAATGIGLVLVCSWFSDTNLWISPLAIPPVVFALANRLPFVSWETRLGGDYSYGIYIYGMPVQQCLASFGVHRLGLAVYLGAGLVAALAMAWLSWSFVEAPALRLKSLALCRVTPPLSA